MCFGAHRGRRGGAYHDGRLPTACFKNDAQVITDCQISDLDECMHAFAISSFNVGWVELCRHQA